MVCKSNKSFLAQAAFGHGVYLSNGKQTKTDGLNLDKRGKKNKNKNNSQNWQDIAAAVVADRGGEICCGFKHGPEVGDGEAERGHWGD